jgi:hypothetical protein
VLNVALGNWKTAWTIKVIGDNQVYNEEYKEGTFTNGVIMLKSYVWPGAYIFYKNNRWFNFYLGYGHKADQQVYYPIFPPIPHSDPLERQKYQLEEATEKKEAAKPLTEKEKIERLEAVVSSQDKFKSFLDRIFLMIDTDNSGQVDKSEIDRFLKEVSKALDLDPPEPSEIEDFFKMFDKDKTGNISKEELVEPLKGLILVWIDIMKENLQEASE